MVSRNAITKADILSIYTGYMLSERNMAGLYAAMNHLMGFQHTTEMLLVSAPAAKNLLEQRHPELTQISQAELDKLEQDLIQADDNPSAVSSIQAKWVDDVCSRIAFSVPEDIAPFTHAELTSQHEILRQSHRRQTEVVAEKPVIIVDDRDALQR